MHGPQKDAALLSPSVQIEEPQNYYPITRLPLFLFLFPFLNTYGNHLYPDCTDRCLLGDQKSLGKPQTKSEMDDSSGVTALRAFEIHYRRRRGLKAPIWTSVQSGIFHPNGRQSLFHHHPFYSSGIWLSKLRCGGPIQKPEKRRRNKKNPSLGEDHALYHHYAIDNYALDRLVA